MSDAAAARSAASRSSAPAPRVVAVIDVGSTAIRMEVAEIFPDGAIRTLEALQHPVHLGRDTFTTGRIQQSTIEESVKILRGFRRVMEEYGVDPAQCRAVATSSVREAANRDTFLDRVYMATGINVQAIDEAEETRLTYMAVYELLGEHPELKQGDALVIEVGGGDTELLLLQNGFVNYSNTFRLGTLRMRETLGTRVLSPQRALAMLLKQIQLSVDQMRRMVPVARVLRIIALSGDARFAASQLFPGWGEAKFARLETKTFVSFARKIAGQTPDDLVKSYRLTYPEAEALGPALLSFAQIARVFGAEELIVPKSSLRHGLLRELVAGGRWTREFMEQVEHSALALGAKYAFDERHAKQVADLAVRLFHALQSEHKLPPRYELILRVAALLHEIGLFVNNRSHHKHSMYLIMNSDLFGLSHEDMRLIAMVARYHRRATPQPYHEVYSELSREQRLAVSKLAALLRVADALDRNHMQQVRDVRFSREDSRFVVWVRDVEDLTLERVALKEKGTLFEDVYGLSVEFRTEIAAEGVAADV